MCSRVLLVLLSILAGAPSLAACSRVLRVPFEDWPPYAFLASGRQPAGMEVEMLTAVAREAGCPVKFVFDIPRKRRGLMLRQGELDLLLAASDTAERRQYAWFTRPYRNEDVAAFTLRGNHSASRLTSLVMALQGRYGLIAPSDGWYGATFDGLVREFAAAGLLTRYESYAQAMRMLGGDRGQVLIGDRFALLDAARQNDIKLLSLPFNVNHDPVHFMLSRRSLQESDLAALNRAIVRLERRGTLSDIRARYLDSLTSSR
ncbi:amino acid ABC transporter substrate-binding protein [Chitinimonas arctica]|uniref:Amino acid ABC transporter substrate-binding protein n=1 Tax=Chitinimonas arctica TaxID=2594795 RepID=A0A516SCV1_9NEIS|nr:transporter substrate-binding domain-containing protein [Chitinimonas arctica]QDQ25878.1 amino acid ABC transporter substrate-binding protein [Chitinimonas arctica]